MSAPGKLVRSSRWKSGASKGQRPADFPVQVPSKYRSLALENAIDVAGGAPTEVEVVRPIRNQAAWRRRRQTIKEVRDAG
jgi:hypothetical protein